MPADYQSAARALSVSPSRNSPTSAERLASPDEFDSSPTTTTAPSSWRHHHTHSTNHRSSFSFSRFASSSSPARPSLHLPTSFADLQSQARATTGHFAAHGTSLYKRLGPVRTALLTVVGLALFVSSVLFLVYHERLFASLAEPAARWRHKPQTAIILWLATTIVAFPPLIGYSSLLTLTGFIYGVGLGFPLAATANITGATLAFLAARTVLANFVRRLLARDTRFAALSAVLRHDGLGLLVLIRLCPLPYSLSNGALAAVPSVRTGPFAAATAVAALKLVIPLFIGSQFKSLGQGQMSGSARAVKWASILVSMTVGVATGYIIWGRMKKRAAELQRQEALGAGDDDDAEGHWESGEAAPRAQRGARAPPGSVREAGPERRNYTDAGMDDGGGAGTPTEEYRDVFDEEDAAEAK